MASPPAGALYGSRLSLASVRPDLKDERSQSPDPPNSVLQRLGSHLTTIECHGVSSLAHSSRWTLRLVWGLILLVAFAVTIFFLVRSTQEYMDNPIVTTYDFMSDAKLHFPNVYICPSNSINTTFMRLAGIDPGWASYFLRGLDAGEWSEEPLPPPAKPGTTTISRNISLPDYFMSIGYTTAAFFKECKFKGRLFNCSDKVSEVFDAERGKCFLVTIDWPQTKSGQGLSLILDLHTSEYPPLNSSVTSPTADGARIRLSSNHTPAPAEEIFIGPGTLTKVALQAKRIQRITGHSYGIKQQCTASASTNLSVLTVATYTKDVCQIDCLQEIVMNECGCIAAVDPRWVLANISAHIKTTDVFKARNKSEIFCLRGDVERCVGRVKSDMTTELEACESRCHPACMEWSYGPTTSQLAFPDIQRRQQWKSATYMEDNLLSIHIAYSKLQHINIVQSQSMTFASFVSNIGGTMGVWMGASLLTVLQAVILLVTAFCNDSKR